MSDCGHYLVIAISEGCDPVNRLYFTDLRTLPEGLTGILPYVKVVDNFDAEYEVLLNFKSYANFHLCNFNIIYLKDPSVDYNTWP